jgi:hypothetical protein
MVKVGRGGGNIPPFASLTALANASPSFISKSPSFEMVAAQDLVVFHQEDSSSAHAFPSFPENTAILDGTLLF